MNSHKKERKYVLRKGMTRLCIQTGPALGDANPIVLCKTCSVLLCVLEQPRVDNSNGVQ